MEKNKNTKWDIGTAITKGKESNSLYDAHKTDLENRFEENVIEQHKANVLELEKRRAGQKENLTAQKSTTEGQVEAIRLVKIRTGSIRKIVKGANAPRELQKAFGVGEKFSSTVSDATASANLVITAYHDNKEWCNKKGIIDEDIAEITALSDSLKDADDHQTETIFTRKAATMDKNTLHREVEDIVTLISCIGMHVFGIKDPAVAQLFDDLIPPAAKTAKKSTTEATASK